MDGLEAGVWRVERVADRVLEVLERKVLRKLWRECYKAGRGRCRLGDLVDEIGLIAYDG